MPTSAPCTVRWRAHFRSLPERVFEALATDEGRARYWAESARASEGVITFSFCGHPPVMGRILRCEPPHLFTVEYFGSTVEFALQSDGSGGTDLLLSASGIDEREREDVVAGWVSVLLTMKAAVDFGVDLRNHDPARCWSTGYADN